MVVRWAGDGATQSAMVRGQDYMNEEEINARIAELENEVAEAKKAKADAIGEKNKAKRDLTALEERLTTLEADRETALDTTKTEAEKASAALQRQITNLEQKLFASEAREATYRIDGAISEAIAKAGVLPHFVPAVTAMMKSGAKMEKGEAFADGIPLADKLSQFFASEDARHYVAAAGNSGGNAQGSSAKASEWTKPPEAHEIMRWTDYAVANPKEANSQADSWARPDLKV